MASNNSNEIHVSNEDEFNEINKKSTTSINSPKKKITIVVDEDDPCLKKDEKRKEQKAVARVPGLDPRFQQQNQTLRCWVMYTDFYRCERILGEGSDACTWFKDVFSSICPNDWIYRWDELRAEGKFP